MSFLRTLFLFGINNVKPQTLIKNIKKDQLEYKVKNKNVYIVGFGKAALGFLRPLAVRLNNNFEKALFSIPEPSKDEVINYPELFDVPEISKSKTRVYYGSRLNVTNEVVIQFSKDVFEIVTSLSKNDCLIVTITGGGSALLCCPTNNITLNDIVFTTKNLSEMGANIHELNLIRRKLDKLKGGGLANYCNSDTIISFILSDVIGDNLSTIASGPTFVGEDKCNSLEPIEIIRKYKLEKKLPSNIIKCLTSNPTSLGNIPTNNLKTIDNYILGNNQVALTSIANCVEKSHYYPIILTSELDGDCSFISNHLCRLFQSIYHIVELVKTKQTIVKAVEEEVLEVCSNMKIPANLTHDLLDIVKSNDSKHNNLCLLFGGETPVRVKSKNGLIDIGVGGRCSHMGLEMIIQMENMKVLQKSDLKILIGATDGLDGPTDNAGVVIDPLVGQKARQLGIDPNNYLDKFDSFTFWKELDNLSKSEDKFSINTGMTGTNVMDIIIVLLSK